MSDQAWTAVQTAGIVVAAISGVLSLIAVIVTGVLSSRRERASWLRQAQSDAYTKYGDAMQAVVDEFTVGPIEVALGEADMIGLDEAWGKIQPALNGILTHARGVFVLGDTQTIRQVKMFNSSCQSILALGMPIRGAQNAVANQQRFEAISAIGALAIQVSIAMRMDQGLVPFGERRVVQRNLLGPRSIKRLLRRSGTSTADLFIQRFLLPPAEGDGLGLLLKWGVRGRGGNPQTVEEAYFGPSPFQNAEPHPNSLPNANDHVAALYKKEDRAWEFYMEISTPAEFVEQIRAEAAEIVRKNGRGAHVSLNQGSKDVINDTVDGPVTVGRVWLWNVHNL